jgi:hypothetical protein
MWGLVNIVDVTFGLNDTQTSHSTSDLKDLLPQ